VVEKIKQEKAKFVNKKEKNKMGMEEL